MKVTLIGSGNTATVLGKKIKAAGHTISQIIFHSNQPQATELATMLDTIVINNLKDLDMTVDIVLLAVTDTALPAVAHSLPTISGVVLHTAGSVSIEVLHIAERYGVLYPLQSLRKEREFGEIPLLINGNNAATLAVVHHFAATISNRVMQADDACRMKLHTAAVVVSNFTNHLYSLAADYCQQEQVDFTLLQPLIIETAERLQFFKPSDMQTGPAIRNDEATIVRHLQLLETYPQLQKLYEVLTKSIQQFKNEV